MSFNHLLLGLILKIEGYANVHWTEVNDFFLLRKILKHVTFLFIKIRPSHTQPQIIPTVTTALHEQRQELLIILEEKTTYLQHLT
jgi:hypothetical protein